MSTQIDFALGTGLFIVFVALLLSYLIAYITNTSGSLTSSNLRTAAYDIYRAMFSGKGLPQNWENYPYTPVRIGLVTDLYSMPVVITETNGTARTNTTINFTVAYDASCASKAWNNTVRLYDDSGNKITAALYNQSFCSGQYLNTSDLVFNLTLNANQNKTFFIYFSPDAGVQPPSYTIAFPINASNYSAVVYPEEKLSALSLTKLAALRNKTYDDVKQTLGAQYDFYLEVEAV